MGPLPSYSHARIHVESDNLIMRGSPTESAGCVLRGLLNVSLTERTKIKSISLRFSGKMIVSWVEALNGHERFFRSERTIVDHVWDFVPTQSKPCHLEAGDHLYEFELPLSGALPESMHVNNLYHVQYRLKARIRRPGLLRNILSRRDITLSRQLSPVAPEFYEPVEISNQWANKLDYHVSVPTKVFSHGDTIPVTIRMTPLSPGLRVRYLTCSLKEYTICKSRNLVPRTLGYTLFSHRDTKFGNNTASSDAFIEWSKTQLIHIPSSRNVVQCDVQNEAVHIRHKLKFVMSMTNPDGHISELRASIPITIAAMSFTGLPAYEDTWQSLPYDPSTMLAMLVQSPSRSLSCTPTYSEATLSDSEHSYAYQDPPPPPYVLV